MLCRVVLTAGVLLPADRSGARTNGILKDGASIQPPQVA